LYLQLRFLGYTGRYDQVIAASAGEHEQVSLGGLANVARRLGFPMVPIKTTTAELAKLPSPAVVLSEESGTGTGRFHLLLGFSSSTAHFVDGTYITRNHVEMTIDQFKREWTGFALIPQERSPWPARWFGAALGSVAAVIG